MREGPPFDCILEIAWYLRDIPEDRCLTTASHNRIQITGLQSQAQSCYERVENQWIQLVCWRIYQRFGSQTFKSSQRRKEKKHFRVSPF